jgi:hypothetical protein
MIDFTDQRRVFLRPAPAAAQRHTPAQRTHTPPTRVDTEQRDGLLVLGSITGAGGISVAPLLVEQYGRIEIATTASSTSPGE